MDGGMDMGGMDMPMSMDLRLRATCKVGALLFDFWDIQTCGQFMVSFFFIVALCFVRHMLQMHKTRYILTLPTVEPIDSKASLLRASCCGGGGYESVADEGSKLASAEAASGTVNGSNTVVTPRMKLVSTRLRIDMKTRLLLTLYFSLLGASSILVMLLAMTFNLGIILAILIGEGAGHFYFSTDFYHDLLQSGSFH